MQSCISINLLVNKERPAPDTEFPTALLYSDSKNKAFHGNHVYLALAAFQCGQDDSAVGLTVLWKLLSCHRPYLALGVVF